MRYLLVACLNFLVSAVYLVMLSGTADAGVDPILRIETGSHTARIHRMATDTAGKFLVTVSDDKTARLWNAATGELLKIFRPPIGDGDEGKLYSVALSPDGSTVALGGWTIRGKDGDVVYLFNRLSGRIFATLPGFPGVINHLAFTPDGRYLLAASSDLRLFKTADWSMSGTPVYTGSEFTSFDVNANGLVVTASQDGKIRSYKYGLKGFSPQKEIQAPHGKRPITVRLSPDGSSAAIGYEDVPRISLLGVQNLQQSASVPQLQVEGDSLFAVAWSPDGRSLYGAGRWSKQNGTIRQYPLRRWSLKGKESSTDLVTGAGDTIMDLLVLPQGRIAYVSGQPTLGMLAADGRRLFQIDSQLPDFRDYSRFRVSHEGTTVAFSFSQSGTRPASYNLSERSYSSKTDSTPEISRTNNRFTVSNWKNNPSPFINGTPLRLEEHELSRSVAYDDENALFALGTEWYVRLYDRQGNELWKSPTASSVWGIAISGDRRVVTAACGDGTIRWYRIQDGKELLALFPHGDGRRWILWTPGGYYDASLGAEELVGWHLNDENSTSADFFPASRFRGNKFRPDVIDKILVTLDEGSAVQQADNERGKKSSTAKVSEILPPVVTILSPQDGDRISSRTVNLSLNLRMPSGDPVTGIRILIDGRPIPLDRGVKLTPKDAETRTVTITVPGKDSIVAVIAENRHSSSVPAMVHLVWGGEEQRSTEFNIPPKLYLLAVGVSDYKDKSLALRYAAKDAQDLAAAFKKQEGGLYREVVTRILVDGAATKDDILDNLDWLRRQATSRDVAAIFIAGHGVTDHAGIYYFLPQNADTEKLMRTGLAFSDIKNTLASVAGKAVLFVDTCHAGNVMGSRRAATSAASVINDLASAESGTVVFTSSTGRQYSLEDEKWENGAFTKALVEGLSGKADYTKKGSITINMLDTYISERVKELTDGKQTPTTAKPQTIQDFPLAFSR